MILLSSRKNNLLWYSDSQSLFIYTDSEKNENVLEKKEGIVHEDDVMMTQDKRTEFIDSLTRRKDRSKNMFSTIV
jgi:hypothetical protein